MKRVSVALVATAAVLATACGGGGGGSSSSGDGYTGKTTAASIANPGGAVQLSGTVVTSAQSQVSGVAGYVPTSSGGKARLAKFFPLGTPVDDQCGGTYTEDSTATSFSVVFNNYHPDGPDMGAPTCNNNLYLNGGMSGAWSSNAQYEQASVTFNDFELTLVPDTMGYDGTMVVRDYFGAKLESVASFVLTYNNVALMKTEDFALSADANGNMLAISGKYYMAEQGYLVFATTTNLGYTAGCVGGEPDSGVFTITSAEGVWTMDFGAGYAYQGCGTVYVTPPTGHGSPEYVAMQ